VSDKASTTTFAGPGTYLRSEVNSAMAAKCRCCLADHGSETRVSAVTNGLWSVHGWKSHPSRMCLKCLMAAAVARSSRSSIEFFDSAGCSLREKEPNGCHDPCTCWWSALPMWVSDAFIARTMAALGAGCAVASTCLLLWNALSRAGIRSSVFLPLFRGQ
jgi:hypothetical protein